MISAWTLVVIVAGTLALASAITHAVLARRNTLGLALGALGTTIALGLLGTVLGLRAAYGAAAYANPSEKATLLAQGISQAMNTTAFAVAALVLWIAPFVVGEVRRARRGRREPQG